MNDVLKLRRLEKEVERLVMLTRQPEASVNDWTAYRRREYGVGDLLISGGVGGLDESVLCFGLTVSGTTLTVGAGLIEIARVGKYTVTGATITLGGNKWIYAWHNVDHSASGVSYSASMPTDTASQYYWVLAYYEGTTLITRYNVGTSIVIGTPGR